MKFDLVVPTAKETRRRLFSRFIHTDNFPISPSMKPLLRRLQVPTHNCCINLLFLAVWRVRALSTRICTSLPSAKEDRSVYLARTIYLTSEQIEKSNIWQTDELWGAISNASECGWLQLASEKMWRVFVRKGFSQRMVPERVCFFSAEGYSLHMRRIISSIKCSDN